MEHDKPKDHTLLMAGWYNPKTGEGGIAKTERIDFCNVARFEDLPEAVQCESVRRDFEAFKAWERQQG